MIICYLLMGCNTSRVSKVQYLNEMDCAEIITKNDRLKNHYIRLSLSQRGIGENAIRAKFGRFVLVKFLDTKVALKFVNNHKKVYNKVTKKYEKCGSEYEYYLFNGGASEYTKHTGELYNIVTGKPYPNKLYIDMGKFRLLWSQSDWLYLKDELIAIAKTDLVNIEDVDFEDSKLVWYKKDNIKYEYKKVMDSIHWRMEN